MNKFRLRKNDPKEFNITKDEFKEATKESTEDGYVQVYPQKLKNAFAYCPGCNNPIVLVGIYRNIEGSKNPYGKHTGYSVPRIGEHNQILYENCKHASHLRGECPKDEVKTELTEYERLIYCSLRKYFDKIVYVLQESLGFEVTLNMARTMLYDFVTCNKHMYPLGTVNNLPWMLMYLSDYPLKPYGKRIAVGSVLYKELSKIDGVRFEKIDVNEDDSDVKKAFAKKYEVLKTEHYMEIAVLLMDHRRKRKGEDDAQEFVELEISHRYPNQEQRGNWIEDARYNVEIDQTRLQRIIRSKKAMSFRNEPLLEMAKQLMPNLETE